ISARRWAGAGGQRSGGRGAAGAYDLRPGRRHYAVGSLRLCVLDAAGFDRGAVYAGAAECEQSLTYFVRILLYPEKKEAGGKMTDQEEIYDSPTGWVAQHIRDYVETDGRKGHKWRGVDTLLLTTRGRKSGKLRRTALIYGKDGDNYIVVASRGGHPSHPAWYLNLVANPEVMVQVGADKFKAR